MRHRAPGAIVLGAGLVVCSAAAYAETGRAILHSTTGDQALTGAATLAETKEGLRVTLDLAGVPAGDHGVHIHQYGACGDRGNAAGGHYNPDGVPHGLLPKDGLTLAHPGDLGNVTIGTDGTGTLQVTLPGVSLSAGHYAVAGRAIVLHEKQDDFGQPTGNAGGRIGCGEILIVE